MVGFLGWFRGRYWVGSVVGIGLVLWLVPWSVLGWFRGRYWVGSVVGSVVGIGLVLWLVPWSVLGWFCGWFDATGAGGQAGWVM